MKSVSFILSPRSAGLSHRKPPLTATSYNTFRVQGDDKKKLAVRDTVFIKLSHSFFLVPHIIVARTYGVIDLVKAFRTHGTDFDPDF
jgi:hypothetical protein